MALIWADDNYLLNSDNLLLAEPADADNSDGPCVIYFTGALSETINISVKELYERIRDAEYAQRMRESGYE